MVLATPWLGKWFDSCNCLDLALVQPEGGSWPAIQAGSDMKRLFTVGLSALMVASCAKRPDAIAPASIPFEAYTGQSCDELALALIAEKQNLAALSSSQNSAATGDAVGVFLIGVPLSSVSGGDQEGNIAVSKGKVQALEAARLSKSC
jgi:hypothetical protein